MNNDIFNTPLEEVKRLFEEIKEVKNTLIDLSRKISHIETRVKRAFPAAYPTDSLKEKKSLQVDRQPSLTTDQALHLYDELVSQVGRGDISLVKERLSSMNIAVLNLMRQELGVSLGKKKPSRKVLVEAILGRINESILLTKHVNREQLVSEPLSSEDASDKNSKDRGMS